MSLFSMSLGQARVRLVQAGAVLGTAIVIAGCGAGYRPVVTPINPSGPAAQPNSLVAVVSAPSPTSAGIATIIDYSGDTIVAQAAIGPGPTNFTLDESGTSGYTANSDGTLTNFPVASTLQAKNVTFTTLPTAAQPVALFSPSAGLWASDLNGNVADVLTGSPQTFKLSVPVAPTPITIVGPSLIGERNYAITQGSVATGVDCNISPTTGPLGEADAIETTSYTVSARIPLGHCPVFAVQSPDARRLFVMNRGDDTITVINSQNNTLDACTPFLNQNGQTVTCHPTLPLSTTAVTATGVTPINGTTGMAATAGPVYAEFNVATSQLIVADYDGGTISVIDVSLDEFGNDSQTFGTTFTIPVGANPAGVTALYDGSRAYTANQNDSTVTIVNLTSHSVEKTLPIIGHPRTILSTQNSLYGKVYVASPDSPYLTILRTDQDIVDTTVLVEGNIVDARVSTQNAVSGNANNVSRQPGYGQPCYLPPALMTTTYGAGYTLANCRTLP
jgi:DNA-binding beta-propeller fold protein YncE